MIRISLLLIFLPALVAANDAAMNDGAHGPEPIGWRSGQESIVQMKSEDLKIHFGTRQTHVLATFTFLSHKKGGAATQKLGFPDASRSELEGDVIGPIRNLTTRVNGKKVKSQLVEGYYREIVKPDGSVFYEKRDQPSGEDSFGLTRKYAWHVIEVTFPEGQEVTVEREYDCPTGIDTSMNAFFVYETRTGGAWRDKIERLTTRVTFDENVRTDLIAFTPRNGWTRSEDRTSAQLVWNNFEPREEENRTFFEISTLDLQRIKEIRKENPEDFPDVEEWIRGWKARERDR
jgi:hypothetical protein